MMQKQAWGGRLAVNAPLIVIGLLVLGYSVAQASLHIGSEIAGALCLLLFVAGMMVQAIGRVISNGASGEISTPWSALKRLITVSTLNSTCSSASIRLTWTIFAPANRKPV